MQYQIAPCKGCEERSVGCHSHCPKSARGEYGYPEWKATEANPPKNHTVPNSPAHNAALRRAMRRK